MQPRPRRLRDRRDLRARRAGRRGLAARRALGRASTRPTSRRIERRLRAIAAGESPDIRYPDGRAAMLGIDARKVVATRHLAAGPHRDRAPAARHRPDRRRRHAPAAAGLRRSPSRRSVDPRRTGPQGACARRCSTASSRTGSGSSRSSSPSASPPAARRCARRCGGWRATGTSCATAPAACGPNPPRVSVDARALRRARRARGPRRAHGRPGRGSTA